MTLTLSRNHKSVGACLMEEQSNGMFVCPVCDYKHLGPAYHMCCGNKSKSYPTPKSEEDLSQPCNPGGPGTELKKLLKRFGVKEVPGCKCNKRAAIMDIEGPDWCVEHIEDILRWLEEESHRRKLPFVRLAAKVMVKLAIHKARKQAVK